MAASTIHALSGAPDLETSLRLSEGATALRERPLRSVSTQGDLTCTRLSCGLFLCQFVASIPGLPSQAPITNAWHLHLETPTKHYSLNGLPPFPSCLSGVTQAEINGANCDCLPSNAATPRGLGGACPTGLMEQLWASPSLGPDRHLTSPSSLLAPLSPPQAGWGPVRSPAGILGAWVSGMHADCTLR